MGAVRINPLDKLTLETVPAQFCSDWLKVEITALLHQLAQVTAERDEARELEIQMTATGARASIELSNKLLASAAENVRMKSALEYVSSHRGPETDSTRMADKALSSAPTALVGAIEGMREALKHPPCKCKELFERNHRFNPPGATITDYACYRCTARTALAAYDDALGKGKV